MRQQTIRTIAICVIEDQGDLLVFEGFDVVKGDHYYRPLGGGIEFGESGAECVARELREEIGAQLEDLEYAGLIENRFVCNGEAGHEIVLVYRARLVDVERYRQGPLTVCENGERVVGRWIAWDECRSGARRLVPHELLDLFDDRRRRS